jgi:hypothetical protein
MHEKSYPDCYAGPQPACVAGSVVTGGRSSICCRCEYCFSFAYADSDRLFAG